MAGSQGKWMFNFLTDRPALFQNVCTRASLTPLHMVSLFCLRHSGRGVVIAHCGFNLPRLMTDSVAGLPCREEAKQRQAEPTCRCSADDQPQAIDMSVTLRWSQPPAFRPPPPPADATRGGNKLTPPSPAQTTDS